MSQSGSSPELVKPLTGIALWATAIVLSMSNLIVVLDLSVANVSLPQIASGLSASTSQGTWVITSYGAAEAMVIPLNGWLVRRFGAVRCFIWCVLGFGVCSALCGLATSLGMLIFFRVLQGVFGGPLMPLTQTLLMHIFPREKHASALSIWVAATLVGPALGPIIGGVITDNWSWRWIFLINVPVVVLCLALAGPILKGRETETGRPPIDYVGIGLLFLWVASLQLMLDKGLELDWFDSPLVVVLGLVAAIGFAAFLIWELTEAHPIIDLHLFRNRAFSVGVAAQCAGFAVSFSAYVFAPLFFQGALGYTATQAGYATALTAMAAILGGVFAGWLLSRFDARLVVSFGMAWIGFACLVRTWWSSGIEFWFAALPQFIQGLGVPIFFIGSTTIAMAAIDPKDNASATGTMNFLRTLSGAFAVAITTSIWDHSNRSNHAELAATLNDPDPAIATFQQFGFTRQQALGAIDQIVNVESLTLATTHIFWLSAIVMAVAALLIWFVPRPARHVDVSAIH